jgi:tRNA(fMet)-specific endonuclease VapC
MTYLLDTDHVTILGQKGGREWPVVVAHIHARGQANVGTSIVSLHEQFRGCHARINQARKSSDLVRWYQKLLDVTDLFAGMNLVPFDVNASDELDRLDAMNLRVNAMDLRIASIALAHNLTLVTRNVSDFGKVPGLRTEDWTK